MLNRLGVASTSAGRELPRNVVIVIGNATGMPDTLTIAHSFMGDAIDVAGAAKAFAGIVLKRVLNVFAKAECSPGSVRSTLLAFSSGERRKLQATTVLSVASRRNGMPAAP